MITPCCCEHEYQITGVEFSTLVLLVVGIFVLIPTLIEVGEWLARRVMGDRR